MTERVANPQRGAAAKRASSIQVDKSKAAKRAAAKAAKARAVAAEKRRRILSIVGAAAAVLLLIVGIAWYAQSGDPSTPAASSSGAASDAASQDAAAAFPPLPAGADPALGTKPTVTAGTGTVSKLGVTTLIEGKGAAAQAGQTITVNYVGVTFVDGKEFDASWNKSQPLDFQLGAGGVIQGWDQGLVGVKVGSRVQLDIPSAMAYGDNPEGGRPPGALRFVVDLLAAA